MALKTRIMEMCEVAELIEEVMVMTSKDWSEVENSFFKNDIYPEGFTSSISLDESGMIVTDENYKWLNDALVKILATCEKDTLFIELE